MKSNRNERKICVLNILSYYSERPYSSKKIAKLCPDVSVSSIRTSLKTYYNQGLLKRKKENGVFVYWITEEGLKRLEFLIGKKTVKDQVQLLVREPIRKIKLLEREPIKNIEKLLKI